MSAKVPLGNVLVVGGCGFLGSHIIDKVLRTDPDSKVYVLDLKTESNRHSSVTYYDGDISQRGHVAEVMQKVRPQVIFHTASPDALSRNLALFQKVNVDGTRNILECAKEIGTVKALVYTSSSSVVHDHISPLVEATEDMPVLYYPQQPEPYAHTKALAEDLVLAANRLNGSLLSAAIRPAMIYGERESPTNGTARNLTKAAQSGRARTQLGDGKNLWDGTYVGNCAYAHVLAAQALLAAANSDPLPKDKRVEGEPFFVTDGEHFSFWVNTRKVAEFAGHPVRKEEIRTVPTWLIMAIAFLVEWGFWLVTLGKKESAFTRRIVRLVTVDRTFCIDKIRNRLGYHPRVSTEEGFRRAVQSYLSEADAQEKKAQ